MYGEDPATTALQQGHKICSKLIEDHCHQQHKPQHSTPSLNQTGTSRSCRPDDASSQATEANPKEAPARAPWVSVVDGGGQMYFYNTDTGVSQWHPPDPKLVRPPTQAFVSDFAFPAPGEEGAHQYMCMPGDDLTPRQWNIEYTTAWLQWNFVTYHAVWAKFLSPLHPVRHSLGFENSLQAQRYAPLPYIRG